MAEMLPPDRVPLPGRKDVSSAARERIPLLTRPIERTDRLEEKRPWFARPGIAVHGSVEEACTSVSLRIARRLFASHMGGRNGLRRLSRTADEFVVWR